MSYAAEWDAEHAKREMYGGPLQSTKTFFETWKDADNPRRVLDIGCGQGTNTIWLAQQGFKVWGFDSSPVAVNRLLKYSLNNGLYKLRTAPQAIVADATKPWPYIAGAFDIAFEIRVLENLTVEEAQFAYKEVGRVLKPDGIFYCLTASPGRKDKHTTVGRMRTTTDLKLADWLAAAGL